MADSRRGSGSGRDYRLGRLRGRWVVVWEEGGKRKRWRLVRAETAIEARAALRDFARERDALTRPARGLTVGEIFDAYIEEKLADGKSVERIRDAWKPLGPWAGNHATGYVTADAVRSYVAARRAQRISDGTIHTELGYLRAALRHSARNGSIPHAPIIALPPKPRPRSRHLTSEEARKLIDAAQMPHVRLFIELALHTAGRPSSILDLTWDRVEFERSLIRLDNPGRDRTAKGRATVPITDDKLRRSLGEARIAAQTSHVIEWAGKPVASIKKGVREAARRAGLKGVTPYVLRHTAAVWMAEGGVPMEEIAQYMGHTSPAVTFRTYARFSPDYLRRAGEAISKRLA